MAKNGFTLMDSDSKGTILRDGCAKRYGME